MSKRIVCAFTPAEAEALQKHLAWVNQATNDMALFDVQCKIDLAVDRASLEWSEKRHGSYSDSYRVARAYYSGYELKVSEDTKDGRWSWYFGEDSGFCCVDSNRRYDRIEDAKADAEAAVRAIVALFGKVVQ